MSRKVTIIGTTWPFRGGLTVYNERLAREFQSQGDEVTVETFSMQYPGFLFPGKSQFSDTPAPKDLTIRQSINSVNPISWLKVGKRIAKERPDLVVIKFWLPFMGPAFGTILRLIKKNMHTKIVSILDNIIPHESRPGDKVFANYFVKPVDGFIGQSHSVIDDFKTFNTGKPCIYNAHPIYDNFGEQRSREKAIANLGLDPNFRYMLFFGFIRDYKGLDLMLESFADDRFREKPIRLIVAGEFYSDAEPYLEIIRKHKLEECVIQHTDFIPDDQVADFFCASDIVVQPYKSATQSGITQIAYHFNNPMLVTNVGGLPEIVPHEKVGYVVDVDKDAITDALMDFYENNRHQAMTENVVTEKERFSWSYMVNSIWSLHDQV